VNPRERFAALADLGYDAIPLLPGTKNPVAVGWQRVIPGDQWATAPDAANIGIRGGGSVRAVFLDCDDLDTAQTAQRWAAGLGYMPDGDYPLIQTARGLRHLYMTSADPIAGDWRRLRQTFGKGELRYGSGAYVVGPGSIVNGREYALIAGDLRQLPRMERADLRELADVDAGPVVRPSTPDIPRAAAALLSGQNVDRYRSRSEAEAALITSLVNAGHDFGSVLALFQLHPCAGKYTELRQAAGDREALRWLRRTYDVQAAWAEAHESTGRTRARAALAWALDRPWPGRVGSSDRAVFLAHAEIARQAGKLEYAASVRRLAEAAGIAVDTAQKANRRLLEAGLVTSVSPAFATAANVYALSGQSQYTSPQAYRGEVYRVCPSDDVWRFRGLGKRALAIWQYLRSHPGATVAELAEATGCCVKTVRRAIAKMTRLIDPETAEVLRLVAADGAGWRAVEADMEAGARAVGTAGAAEKQRKTHSQQRAGFARAIARATAGTTPEAGRG
jgi:hypothetical protein